MALLAAETGHPPALAFPCVNCGEQEWTSQQQSPGLLRRAKSAAAAQGDEDRSGPERADGTAGGPEDFDLEAGIAEIFAAIRSGAGSDLSPGDLPEDTGATYALLSRLDELWQTSALNGT